MDPYKVRQERNEEMKINTTLSQDVSNYSQMERLDRACCRLLANKPILAWLLKAIVPEYEHCTVQSIMDNHLEGNLSVRSIPVDQDVKIYDSGRIQGANTVDKSMGEGTVDYDILFTATLPVTRETCQIIVNVENQNIWNPGYPLLKRAVYYCSRLVSRQKGTIFNADEYGKIEKVYSVWICSKPAKPWRNSMTTFSLEPTYLVGAREYDKIEYDLETIAILGLGSSERKQRDILKLLSVLMEPRMETERKKQILEKDFAIPMTVEMEREASEMCTLGESIARENLEKGLLKGRNEGIRQERESNILGMLREKIPMETIARITKVSVEQIKEIGKLHGVL